MAVQSPQQPKMPATVLPKLNEVIRRFFKEDVKLRGTIDELRRTAGITKGQYEGWMKRNSFDKEPLRRLLKKLKSIEEKTGTKRWPTTDPDKLKAFYRFELRGSSTAREKKEDSLGTLWGANGKWRRQRELGPGLAVETLKALHESCYLVLFTSTVYPLIYRDGKNDHYTEDIAAALALALTKGARVMVFIPSQRRIDQIKARVGPDGIYARRNFSEGFDDCRISVKREMQKIRQELIRQGKEKQALDEAVIQCRLYTHLGQITCDEEFVTCATGRVTFLLGDHGKMHKPQLWGGERFSDDSVFGYSRKGAFLRIWTERIRHEAAYMLDQEIARLKTCLRANGLTKEEQGKLTQGLKGAEALRRMLVWEQDTFKE